MNAMFAQLRNEPQFSSQVITKTKTLNTQKFVDLGSGDGRVVFRAAREYNMFATSVGYEINPFLHAWASCQRIWSGPEIWSKTVFHCADLWHVNLRDANVVAVVRFFFVACMPGLPSKAVVCPFLITRRFLWMDCSVRTGSHNEKSRRQTSRRVEAWIVRSIQCLCHSRLEARASKSRRC